MSKSHIILVLDSSGSMQETEEKRKSTVVAFNEQVQQMKLDSKEKDIVASLFTFNGGVFEHYWQTPASELEEAAIDSYQPNGGTALHDALGYVAQKILDNHDKEQKYLVVCLSDGGENSSSKYSGAKLKIVLDKLTAKGNVDVLRIGYNGEDTAKFLREAGASNFRAASNIDYSNAGERARMFNAVNSTVRSFYCSTDGGTLDQQVWESKLAASPTIQVSCLYADPQVEAKQDITRSWKVFGVSKKLA